MAKDIDLTKNVSDETPDEEVKDAVDTKAEKPAKESKEKNARPSRSSKKKKKGIVKYFKDARSEFKKVVWPSPKQTTNNTVVVLIMCIIAAIFIFGIDSIFGLLNKLLLGQG
ncbi:MAG: preprotein translocase subunit SecE [Oscillospiraceae bacterium]|nr:preprotein translocase subunit SecE [Oscillospiraceae bacterium]